MEPLTFAGVRYVLGAIRDVLDLKLHSVEVKADVQAAYNAKLRERLKGTVWSTGCKSWYLDAAGKNTTLWPGFTFSYRNITRRFDSENYVIVEDTQLTQ